MFNIQVKGHSVGTRVFSYTSPITREVTEFHVERGIVTIQGSHYKTGEEYYKRESCREFLCRAAALSLELKHMQYGDERVGLQRCVETMVLAAKVAKAQGDPFDDRHMDDMCRDRPQRTVVGGGGYRYDPGVPPIPRAPDHKPVVHVGGEVVSPSRLIIPGR